MEIPEFLEKLREKGRGKFKFWPTAVGGRRLIRTEKFLCPIEYLAGKIGAYSSAGPALGLSGNDIGAIIFAADDFRDMDHELRSQLLEAVGLTPPASQEPQGAKQIEKA